MIVKMSHDVQQLFWHLVVMHIGVQLSPEWLGACLNVWKVCGCCLDSQQVSKHLMNIRTLVSKHASRWASLWTLSIPESFWMFDDNLDRFWLSNKHPHTIWTSGRHSCLDRCLDIWEASGWAWGCLISIIMSVWHLTGIWMGAWMYGEHPDAVQMSDVPMYRHADVCQASEQVSGHQTSNQTSSKCLMDVQMHVLMSKMAQQPNIFARLYNLLYTAKCCK